jgi:hypothetical protein
VRVFLGSGGAPACLPGRHHEKGQAPQRPPLIDQLTLATPARALTQDANTLADRLRDCGSLLRSFGAQASLSSIDETGSGRVL